MKRHILREKRSGFTLVEIMMVMTISILVFSAMNVVLSRSFSFWRDGMGYWQLAQQARQTRARILHNNFLNGYGMLSIDNLSLENDRIEYTLLGDGDDYFFYTGSSSATNTQPYFNYDSGTVEYWLLHAAEKRENNAPIVRISHFTPTLSNDVLTLNYQLIYEIGGKSYEQPQVIQAYLVNQ